MEKIWNEIIDAAKGIIRTNALDGMSYGVGKELLLKTRNNSSGFNNSYIKPTDWNNIKNLESFRNKIIGCKNCKLGNTRKNLVFGSGNPKANVLFIGEGPGHEEDIQGQPFVGRSGKLLTKMIEAIKFTRQEVYIANIVKCRPPNNRNPQDDEIKECLPYLQHQIKTIEPKVICLLGRVAAQSFLKTKESMSRLRGRIFDYAGIKMIVTFHPAALLRNPNWKRLAWEDVQLLRKIHDEEVEK